jgi:hypothetical protein
MVEYVADKVVQRNGAKTLSRKGFILLLCDLVPLR